jgi:hypothetical protein
MKLLGILVLFSLLLAVSALVTKENVFLYMHDLIESCLAEKLTWVQCSDSAIIQHPELETIRSFQLYFPSLFNGMKNTINGRAG